MKSVDVPDILLTSVIREQRKSNVGTVASWVIHRGSVKIRMFIGGE